MVQRIAMFSAAELFLFFALGGFSSHAADEPKQTPQNTISVQLAEPVKPQIFSRPVKFFVADVIDRTGNARPGSVTEESGGVFLDRLPTEIVRQALQDSLSTADMLAPEQNSADYLLNVYVFQFGLGSAGKIHWPIRPKSVFYGKVEFSVVVKNMKTGKSCTVAASGTSAGAFYTKDTMQIQIRAKLEEALEAALRNFLRGTKLRDEVESPAVGSQ